MDQQWSCVNELQKTVHTLNQRISETTPVVVHSPPSPAPGSPVKGYKAEITCCWPKCGRVIKANSLCGCNRLQYGRVGESGAECVLFCLCANPQETVHNVPGTAMHRLAYYNRTKRTEIDCQKSDWLRQIRRDVKNHPDTNCLAYAGFGLDGDNEWILPPGHVAMQQLSFDASGLGAFGDLMNT